MQRQSNTLGVVSMLAATAAFVAGDTFMKWVAQDLPPLETLFLRNIVASAFCGVLVVWRGERQLLPGALETTTLLRAAGETLGTLFYVIALARMPIAGVVAILQTAPLILILGAAALLGERIGGARVALALAGFAGAVLVAHPGPEGLSPAAGFAFGAALLVAGRDLVGRRVPDRVPVTVVAFSTMTMETVAAGAASWAFEAPISPSLRHLAFLALAGLFVVLGQVGLLLAYRLGRTATIAPFFYSFALWGLVAGLLVWGQIPDVVALAGIGLIVASGVAIVRLDRRKIELTEAL